MSQWHRRRYWVYGPLVALIALDVALYAMWIGSPLESGTTGAGQVILLQREVAELTREVSRLRTVHEHLPELGPKIRQFSSERLLSAATGFSEIAEDLETAAGKTGVALKRIGYNVKGVEELPDLSRLEVSTSVEGSYGQLLLYIETLEQSPRLYIIEDVEVSGTAGRHLRLEMQLSAYRNRGV